MRIIAGTKRAMKLLGPKTGESRPITDRVKESLFSVLCKYDMPNGKVVADLFSGVGSLGLEAASRGAEFVTFVERDPKIIAILNRNIEKAGFVKQSKVIRADAFKIGVPTDRVRKATSNGAGERKYTMVFVDPPYSATRDVGEGSLLSGLLNLLSDQLAASGIVAVRTDSHTELLERYGRLRVIERRRWGSMAVTILQRSGR